MTYSLVDYIDQYERIMQFDKNKTAFIHQWYPFVEGYSKEFIQSVIDDLEGTPTRALDPFAGSGTTPLELQSIGISCHSFEVSPFMHLLATVKLEQKYTHEGFQDALITVGEVLNGPELPIRSLLAPPIAKTIQEKEGLEKWIFDSIVLDGILDIKYAIGKLEDPKYQKLFKVILASILLDVSNVYRDGKSIKYKKNWKEKKNSRTDVHNKFIARLTEIVEPDIIQLEKIDFEVDNSNICIHGDVRSNLPRLENDSIDLVITSPPYLNSRDYTDIYIVELWTLDLIHNYDQLRNLRASTIRSHVQIQHGEVELLDISILKKAINDLSLNHPETWNKELPGMIKGYFQDMNSLFKELSKKMISGGQVYFNVANSAYYGIEIEVDNIVAEIAEKNGFAVSEIRKARNLRPSSQQKDLIKSLRETVIVLNT